MSDEEITPVTMEEIEKDNQTHDDEDEDLGVPSGVPQNQEQLIDEPYYEDNRIQLISDIARDESLRIIAGFIQNSSRMGINIKNRVLVFAAASLSKNQVFSNIQNTRDFLMVQDDKEYIQKLMKLDLTTYDATADFLTILGQIDYNHNLRLRRSKSALNLKQVNTTRSEQVDIQHEEDEEKRVNKKIPIIGRFQG